MFTREIANELKFYVYRLIDPRDGSTFYVGKGQGNRVFEHAMGKHDEDLDKNSEKLTRIHKIRLAGFEAQHVIHRHGMDSKTAYEVEAALLDAYPGTTNIAGGHSGDRGVMHASEVIEKFKAEVADIRHNMIAIIINKHAAELGVYGAVQLSWKLDKRRAEKAEYILAVVHGQIVGVFVAHRWMPATTANFPHHHDVPERLGFEGEEAPEVIQKLYMRKLLPERYRRRGAANPVKYVQP